MCGIVGIFNKSEPISKDKLLSATRKLEHRGPDGEGLWVSSNGNIGLGHRRLAIVDERGGVQPIISRNGEIATVVNGELYGYQETRKTLKKKGYVFRTKSDSEIVLYLYQEYGEGFAKYLRGEFAVIIYDKKRNRIIAARDRFGIKPLQYYLDSVGTLYLASEAKAILATGVNPCFDEYAIYHSLSLQYLPQDRTVFNGIYQIKPGYILTYDGSNVKLKKYWDLDFPKEEGLLEKPWSENKIEERLENLLIESVLLRLQSDTAKHCCHTSGGVDSGLIAALAARLGKQKMHCFTVSFPHKTYDEAKLSKRLARHIGAEFTEVVVGPAEMVNNIDAAVYQGESTIINNHLVAKYLLNKETRRAGYKIALTGEGADECFAGYAHLREDLLGEKTVHADPDSIVSGVHSPVGEYFDLSLVEKKLGYIPTFLKAKSSIGLKIQSLLLDSFKKRYSTDMITKNFMGSVSVRDQLRNRTHIDQTLYLWTKFTLANSILKTLGDSQEMGNGVEGRVPFLDHKLFEFSKQIPIQLKISGGVQKYILRKIARKYLPREIADRPKQPFMAPPLTLFKNKTGVKFLEDSFTSIEFKNMGIFDQDKTLKLLGKVRASDLKTQIAAEPVLMLALSTYLLHKNYKMKNL